MKKPKKKVKKVSLEQSYIETLKEELHKMVDDMIDHMGLMNEHVGMWGSLTSVNRLKTQVGFATEHRLFLSRKIIETEEGRSQNEVEFMNQEFKPPNE